MAMFFFQAYQYGVPQLFSCEDPYRIFNVPWHHDQLHAQGQFEHRHRPNDGRLGGTVCQQNIYGEVSLIKSST